MLAAPVPDPFSTVHGVDEETRTHAAYRWDNRRRSDAQDVVVQQTLSGQAFFEDAGGRRLVPAGQAMLFSHDEDSRYGYPPEATEPYRQRFISFRMAGLGAWFERLRTEFGPIVRMRVDGEAAAVMDDLFRHFRTRSFRDRFHETELLHQLLVALYREQVAESQASDPIEYGYHHIRDRFRSPVNLKEVAVRCGVSREHFIRTFHHRYGEPPGETLRRLRLEHARRMLRTTQLAVQEVALACGFADANSFSRAYRHRFGHTPSHTRTGPASLA